jgi:hypothetical protein
MKKLAGLPAKFHSTGFRQTLRSPTGIGGALIRPPPRSARKQHQEARRGQCDMLATDTKNGRRNSEGYIKFGKCVASSLLLIPTTTDWLKMPPWERDHAHASQLERESTSATLNAPPANATMPMQASWNANETMSMSATLNSTPDARVSGVAKRRARWEAGGWGAPSAGSFPPR